MIHFIPEPVADDRGAQGPYAEAVSRLASIRQALACVEQFAGEEQSDSMAEAKLATVWPVASPAHQRIYEVRSTRTAAAAAAGLEALAALESGNVPPHRAAIQRLKRELGSGVGEIDRLFSL